MNSHLEPDDPAAVGVLDALRESLHEITMSIPVERIESLARGRVWRRRVAGALAATTAVAGLVLGGHLYGNPATAPPQSNGAQTQPAQAVHILTAAYSVDSQPDGTIHVTWDKSRYFTDHAGLASALQKAGLPVLMKVGEFCKGPHDDGTLLAGGVGAGVQAVMKGEDAPDGKVTFVFTPSALPAGSELFIGFLNQDQLAITHGRPGSIERLVPTSGGLTCSTQIPAVTG